ncbi:MAG: hypothetical protein KKE08_20485 [Gammaproteobacteria bacterium]|nr:hypothetical protein [Gammaproteobacteria bacterium]
MAVTITGMPSDLAVWVGGPTAIPFPNAALKAVASVTTKVVGDGSPAGYVDVWINGIHFAIEGGVAVNVPIPVSQILTTANMV